MIADTIHAAMSGWLSLAEPVQWCVLALVGLAMGAVANHAITTWCWYNRPSSPWANPDRWQFKGEMTAVVAALPPRPWWSRVPVIGWLAMRRQSPLFGRGFWVRPMLIELALAIGLPVMHEAYLGGVLLPAAVPPATLTACQPWLAWIFFGHAGLVGVMVAATFIDFDERTIPDALTVPGTWAGLVLATLSPLLFPPGLEVKGLGPVLFSSPGPPLAAWLGSRGLMTALTIWSVYCFALNDRRWISRRGWAKAWAWFWHALTRTGMWKRWLIMWFVGMIMIIAIWQVGGLAWIGLFTSLCGLAVGGGLIWGVRLIGRLALGKEAMGFGDVTLMAMIGAFVGWQAAVVSFFLSPMAACLIVLLRWLITRDAATPYGPYLCAGVGLTMYFWDAVYNANMRLTLMLMGADVFWFGIAMAVALLAMLWIWRLVKQWLLTGW